MKIPRTRDTGAGKLNTHWKLENCRHQASSTYKNKLRNTGDCLKVAEEINDCQKTWIGSWTLLERMKGAGDKEKEERYHDPCWVCGQIFLFDNALKCASEAEVSVAKWCIPPVAVCRPPLWFELRVVAAFGWCHSGDFSSLIIKRRILLAQQRNDIFEVSF